LDPDGIALGLIGVLEMLWQDFAFRTEADIDRAAAKRRAMAYLRSVFPGQFSVTVGSAGPGAPVARPAGWVYANGRLFAAEREALFQAAWQFAGHGGRIPRAGDFFSIDLGNERALILRDAAGGVRAFRNSCSEAPHILNAAPAGHLELIRCSVHGLEFDLDGRRRGARGGPDLTRMDVRVMGELILVRSVGQRHLRVDTAGAADPWVDFSPPSASRPVGTARDTAVAADWKIVIEQWLEWAAAAESSQIDGQDWSGRSYLSLLGAAADPARRTRFLAPNHLIEMRADGFAIRQALPIGPGRTLVRTQNYTHCETDRPARAAAYLASRLSPNWRRSAIAVAESTQQGIVAFGHPAADGARAAAVTEFRRQLLALLPMMALARPPNES
jgi:phenylpropionate dioxygenase-like ring-hydroxylating dioxygenase large terminal subunit